MARFADCDPRALAVVMAEVERIIGPERLESIALSDADSSKQYGEFMYHAGQRALLDRLKSAIKKQEQTHGISGS